MGKFIWEPDAAPGGRYRDKSTGRFVKPEVVRGELDSILENSNKDTTQVLAEQLRNRELSVQDWQLEMRAHIKEVHINSIALERGGFQNMTPADYGRAGQIIREQYGYLDKFAKEIQTGEQKLDGTLQARAKLYTEAGRETFYKSKQANITQGDEAATHVASHLNPADHCDECVALDGKIFRIGDKAYKLPGQRICRKNCKCSEVYYRFVDGEYVEVDSG